jgi:hypothetical protein
MAPPIRRRGRHPGLAELCRCKVAALHEAMEDHTTREGAMELILALIEAIVLTPQQPRPAGRGPRRAGTILALGEGSPKQSQNLDSAKQMSGLRDR